jgi:hypothetical protein
VPDFPGCVAAADKLEETRQLMREAIEFHLEGMRRRSLPRISLLNLPHAAAAQRPFDFNSGGHLIGQCLYVGNHSDQPRAAL